MTTAESNRSPGRPKDEGLAARRREEILRQAIAHFARFGYPNADLDAIAVDVGCAKGTLYRYFPSKADLFHQAVDLVMRELLDATSAPDEPDPLRRLQHGVCRFLACFDANPDYVELLIQERAVFRDRDNPTYLEYREQHSERWRRDLRAMMDEGRIRRMPVDRAIDVIGDVLYGSVFMNHFAGRNKRLAKQTEDVLDMLLHGLLTPEEAARWQARR